MRHSLTKEYKIIKNIVKMYEERLTRAVNGQDSIENDIELEILYTMYTTLDESIREIAVPKEIVDAWIAVQLHFTLLSLRENKVNIETFDKIANDLYLDVIE